MKLKPNEQWSEIISTVPISPIKSTSPGSIAELAVRIPDLEDYRNVEVLIKVLRVGDYLMFGMVASGRILNEDTYRKSGWVWSKWFKDGRWYQLVEIPPIMEGFGPIPAALMVDVFISASNKPAIRARVLIDCEAGPSVDSVYD